MRRRQFETPPWFQPSIREDTVKVGGIVGCPVYGDVFGSRVIPEDDWIEAIRDPNNPRMWENVKRVLYQRYNSCASEALTGGAELTNSLQGRHQVIYNPLPLYRRVNGGRDQGSSLSDNVAAAIKHGFTPEEVWGYANGWRTAPSSEAVAVAEHFKLQNVYQINNSSATTFYAEFFSAVLARLPVYFGYSGHAILAVGITEESRVPPAAKECADEVDSWITEKGMAYKMGELSPKLSSIVNSLYIMYLNSWDASWGWNGFGWLRASSVYRAYGAYPIESLIQPEWDRLQHYAMAV